MNYGVHCGRLRIPCWVWFSVFCPGGQVVTGATEKVRPLLGEVGICPDLTYPVSSFLSWEPGLTGVSAGAQRGKSQD